MSRARETARLISNDTFRIDSNNAVGFGSTTPDAMFDINAGLTVAGIITASGGISGAVTGSTSQITVADESSDTTCFPVFVTAATGNLEPKSGSNLTFNSNTGTLETTNVTVTGDLTVQGTTTTIDTDLIGVDKVEVGANNSTVGLAVTQSGSGAIIAAYDGASEVFRVDDGGDISIVDKIIHTGDTNTAIRFPAADTFTVETSGSERLRITSGGKVGIGTNSPGDYDTTANDLVVGTVGGGDRGITIASGTSSRGTLMFSDDTSGLGEYAGYVQYKHNQNAMLFAANSSEAMRISSDGYVGIGTDNPQRHLHLKGTFQIDGTVNAVNDNYSRIYQNSSGSVDYGLQVKHYQGDTDDADAAIVIGGNSSREGNIVFYRDVSGTNTETARFDENGRLGIGTNNPGTNLEVIGGIKAKNTTGSSTLTIQAQNDQLSGVHFSDDAATLGKIEYFHSDNSLRFNTNGSERLAILSSGLIGIGTNNPTALIHAEKGDSGTVFQIERTDAPAKITSQFGGGDSSLRFTVNDASSYIIGIDDNKSDKFKISFGSADNAAFGTNDSLVITTAGNIGIGTETPASRLHAFGNTKLEGDVEITPANTGGEGGHITLRNPDKSSTGAEIDVSSANTFRIFQLNSNSVMELGQFNGQGGIVQFKTQNAIRMKIHATGEVTKPTNPCLKTLSGDTYASTNNLFTSPAVSVLQANTDINIGETGWTTSGTNAYSFVCPVTGVYSVHAHISLGNITENARTIWSMAYTLGGGNFPLANYVEVIDVVVDDYMNYSYQEDWYFTEGTRVAMGKNGTGYQAGYGFHWGIRLVQ